jgi:hypothetical protein
MRGSQDASGIDTLAEVMRSYSCMDRDCEQSNVIMWSLFLIWRFACLGNVGRLKITHIIKSPSPGHPMLNNCVTPLFARRSSQFIIFLYIRIPGIIAWIHISSVEIIVK